MTRGIRLKTGQFVSGDCLESTFFVDIVNEYLEEPDKGMEKKEGMKKFFFYVNFQRIQRDIGPYDSREAAEVDRKKIINAKIKRERHLCEVCNEEIESS